MEEKARQYKPSTIKRLYALSGNQCAAPNCKKSLIAQDKITIIAKIAHIESAEKKGARYNPRMTDDERRHFTNLILLCDEHHSIVDNKENEQIYTVSLLKKWKKNHEHNLIHNKLSSNPSLLKVAINAISNINFDNNDLNIDNSIAFNIDNKISYNEIKRNKSLIDEYKVYYSKLNELYKELEIQGSFKKDNLLRIIKSIYLKIKGKYVGNSTNQISIIKNNSDNIIEDVEQELFDLIAVDSESYQEDIYFGISIIMVDAFMRCKILEEPK